MIDEKNLRIETVNEYCIVDEKNQIIKDGFCSEKEAAKWLEGAYGINHEPKPQPKIGGWIPCSERLPETSEYMEFAPTPCMKRIEIAYMTDTVEYLIGFYDGSKWMDKHLNIIKNVIAWKPFLKLPEAYHGEMDKIQPKGKACLTRKEIKW